MRTSSKLRPLRGFAALLSVVLLVPAWAGSAEGPSGESTTSNTILAVEAGDDHVSVGADIAESERGSATRAHASFTTAKTADSTFEVAEHTAEKASESDTDEAGEDEDFDLGLVSGNLVGAAATATITAGAVAASTSAELASLEVMDGLVTFDGLDTLSATAVDDAEAAATRAITLDGLDLLHVGDLLDVLGVDPFALTCEAVQDAGATLGAETSEACEQLEAAEAAISETGDVLDAELTELEGTTDGLQQDAVQDDRDDAAGAGSACDPAGNPAVYAACVADALAGLVALAAEYDVTLTDPTDLDATRDEVVAGLDAILDAFEDFGLVQTTDLGDTCASVAAAIEEVLDGLSAGDPAGVAAALDAAGVSDDLDAACASLDASLDALLGTPLLRLDGVSIEMDATARVDDPTAEVTASIGSMAIGLEDPIEVDVEGAVEAAQTIGESLEGVVDDLLGDFGVDLEAPEFELLVVETDTGKDDEGDWFAEARLTTLRVTIPGSTLDVAEGADRGLGILDEQAGELGSFGAAPTGFLGAPARAILAATVEAPDVVVDAAVFEADSQYNPSGDLDDDGDDGTDGNDGGDGGDGGPDLPATGTREDLYAALGLLLAAAAWRIRRMLLVR